MLDKLLHTPEGVRDIYNSECERKLEIENSLKKIIHSYGFHTIQTPMFEYFDIFSEERGTVASKDIYKFFDRDGNTLVLRPDITPSIARCIAKYYRNELMPIRLCYCGNTFINNSSYQGKLKEITQLGAELVNDDSIEADAEMVALTVKCLLSAGLTEFQVEIGQADFFRGLIEEAGFQEEEEEQLRILIENKNLFGLEELVSGKKIPEDLKHIFLELPELFGTIDRIKTLKPTIKNKRALNALNRLEELYELVKLYGFEHYLTFDLGMIGKYHYYTGIIFHAITYGTGEAIITGGRYDTLVGQFGKQAPAIGMAVLIDSLLLVLARQKLEKELFTEATLVVYRREYREMAVLLGNQFRSQGLIVQMLVEIQDKTKDEYLAYAQRNHCGGILRLQDAGLVQVIQTTDGSIQEVSITHLMKGN